MRLRRPRAVESRRDRTALVTDAGYGSISLASVVAGVFCAYGAFSVLAGIAGGVVRAAGADTDITARWQDLSVPAGLVVAGILLVAYVFGGYVAGRMARRAGVRHGAAVFLLGLLVVVAVAVAVRQAAGTDAVVARLRDLGLPTTGDEWGQVATVAGVASLAAMLVGSLLGGFLGERWHAKLLARALDPDVGPEADARRLAAEAAARAQDHRTWSVARVEATNPSRAPGADDRVVEPLDTGPDGSVRETAAADTTTEERAAAKRAAEARADERAAEERERAAERVRDRVQERSGSRTPARSRATTGKTATTKKAAGARKAVEGGRRNRRDGRDA